MAGKVSNVFRRDRTEALADGIFATVMTILVLSLVVPAVIGPNTDVELKVQLYNLLPNLLAYVVTFIFLGILWIGHQSILGRIEKFDIKILMINLILLMSVGLIPFSTALLGKYPLVPIANLVYGVNGLGINILYDILWFYPRRRHLISQEPSQTAPVFQLRIAFFGPTVYALAIAFAYVSTYISLALFFSVTAFYIVFAARYAHQ